MEDRRKFIKKMGFAAGAVSLMGTPNLWALKKNELWLGPVRVQGRVTNGKKGLPGVVVSDSETVSRTDRNGHFDFWSSGKQPFVSISLPAGHQIDRQANGSAAFYRPIDANRANNKFLFQLRPVVQSDVKHSLLLLSDPQIQDEYEAEQLLNVTVPDVKATIGDLNDPNTFGVGCGDLVFDRLDLFATYCEAVKQLQVPFFQVIGNHDMDLGTRSDEVSSATFQTLFGPTYYSFNRGEIHYVVLDDVFFTGGTAKEYIGYISESQLAWLEKDLQYITPGSTVVVSTHIPVYSQVRNREHLYEILAPYKVHILSGHTHVNDHDHRPGCFEHCHGTVCGAWWSGPICSDGTPNGYGVYQMDGSQVSWHYKSVGMPKSHQFRFYPKGQHPEFPNACCLNIWNWDPEWKVCWYENGEKRSHIRKMDTTDPLSIALHLGKELPERRTWVEPSTNGHMFLFEPDERTQQITIEVVDRFGKVYKETVVPYPA